MGPLLDPQDVTTFGTGGEIRWEFSGGFTCPLSRPNDCMCNIYWRISY